MIIHRAHGQSQTRMHAKAKWHLLVSGMGQALKLCPGQVIGTQHPRQAVVAWLLQLLLPVHSAALPELSCDVHAGTA